MVRIPLSRRWILILCLAGLAAILLLFCFGVPPDAPNQPFRLVRGDDGQFHPLKGTPAPPSQGAQAHAAVLSASDEFNTSSWQSTSTNYAPFPCRHIAVFNLSDHLLLRRVGPAVARRLEQLGCVERIDYFHLGHGPGEGGLAPDIFVTLDLGKITEVPMPLWRKLNATLLINAGPSLAVSRSTYSDSFSAPTVSFGWQSTLRHRSTRRGFASSSARYKMAADDIVKQIADGLTKFFQKRIEAASAMPDVPKAFYPPYRKAEGLAFLDTYKAKSMAAYHGLMMHNESCWRFVTEQAPSEVFNDIQAQMTPAGWKTRDVDSGKGRIAHLRMTRGEAILDVFPYVQDASLLPGGATGPGAVSLAKTFFVHFADRMTRKEVRAAVDQTLTADAPMGALLMFASAWTQEQRQRALPLLKARQPKTPEALLALADLFEELGQREEALDAVYRAHVMLRTLGDPGNLPARIKGLAKKLGNEALTKKLADAAQLKKMGFIELKPGAETPKVNLALGETALFFARTDKGELKSITLRVVRNTRKGTKAPYSVAHVIASKDTRSWGDGGVVSEARAASQFLNVDGVCRIQFLIRKVPNEKRFGLTITITPKTPKR